MPASWVTGPDGRPIDLIGVARAACHAYVEEFPEYAERYGPPGMLWCVHDNQHILTWAITRHSNELFEHELAWLARVLEARGFPLESLARGIELLATSFTGAHPELEAVAERLGYGAAFVRTRPSFLS